MLSLRTLVTRHPRIAAMVVAVSLLLRILIPSGFMPTVSGEHVLISICSGIEQSSVEVSLPASTSRDVGDHSQGKSAALCAYSGLLGSSLAAVDVVLLAAGMPIAIAVGLVPKLRPPLTVADHLRPPLRGPPATA